MKFNVISTIELINGIPHVINQEVQLIEGEKPLAQIAIEFLVSLLETRPLSTTSYTGFREGKRYKYIVFPLKGNRLKVAFPKTLKLQNTSNNKLFIYLEELTVETQEELDDLLEKIREFEEKEL
jgi:hypothetical protein